MKNIEVMWLIVNSRSHQKAGILRFPETVTPA